MPQPDTTTRRDDLVEVLHGTAVADPYRWLEDPTDPEVRSWVDAQRAVTDPVLAALPGRRRAPRPARRAVVGPRGAVSRGGAGSSGSSCATTACRTRTCCGRSPRPVRRTAAVVPGDDAGWHVLLDPNAWSDDGTASLTGLAVTRRRPPRRLRPLRRRVGLGHLAVARPRRPGGDRAGRHRAVVEVHRRGLAPGRSGVPLRRVRPSRRPARRSRAATTGPAPPAPHRRDRRGRRPGRARPPRPARVGVPPARRRTATGGSS